MIRNNTLTAVAFLVGMTFAGTALAGGPPPPSASSNSSSNSGALAGAANEGNNQNIIFESSNTKIPKNTPSVMAPALTTTLTETCMGSTSAGASVAGFGATFGTTWRDEECVRRLNARELRAMGLGPVAMELMCDNDDIRSAFERAGRRVEDLPQCQRTVDERTQLVGGAPHAVPYTITSRTADPFGNASRNDGKAVDANNDPWADRRSGN